MILADANQVYVRKTVVILSLLPDIEPVVSAKGAVIVEIVRHAAHFYRLLSNSVAIRRPSLALHQRQSRQRVRHAAPPPDGSN